MHTIHLSTQVYLYALLFPIVFTYDCTEICNITLNVMENTPRERLTWNLTDLLSNRTSLFKYLQFSLSSPSEHFEMHSPILHFRAMELDREKICETAITTDDCSLQLQIFTQSSLLIVFKLVILDENDWQPFFTDDDVQLTIRENLPLAYRVQLPTAYDYDSNQYNIGHYEFVANIEEVERLFQLEESQDELRLKLIRSLDCEVKNNYQLYIIAVDKGGYKSNVLHVNITVGDLNEYQPRFTQRLYHTTAPENLPVTNLSSPSVLQIAAVDDDCYDQTILYTILNSDIPGDLFPFEIDNYTGLIRVKRALDYETISTYRFRVRASNLDQITSSIVPIIIDISDVNDNRPLIQMNILNEYKLTENEDTLVVNVNESIRVGQVIGNVLIRDADSGMINYRLSLKIVSCLPVTGACPIELDSGMENNTFSSTTYVIRTSRLLDSEQGDVEFVIMLEARDYGEPSLSSQRRLVVRINDQNDCAPKFARVNYRFRVSNASAIGTLIGQVRASDDDYSPNHRRIQYKLLDYNRPTVFRIDPNNGSLFLERQPSIGMNLNATVLAIDRSNDSVFDQANIQILLFDQAKCSVMFTQAIYVFNTTEHQKIPYQIGQVHVDDCAMPSTPVAYRLNVENSSSPFPFILDAHSGVIKAVAELDRELVAAYQFHVLLVNSTTRADVQINILDRNDHYPIFDDSYEQYIYISTHHYYHQTGNMFIGHVHATDLDDDANGLVNYYFTNKDHYNHFHIYYNGSIFLYNLFNIRLPVRLEIFARDHGYPKPLESQQTIVLYVCDVFAQNECPSNRLRRNFYFGSIVIMVSVVLFLLIIIMCIVWNLFVKDYLKNRESNHSFNSRMEARKNLIVSDSLCDVSPAIYGNPHSKCADV